MLYALLIALAVTFPLCWLHYRKTVEESRESRETLTLAGQTGMTEPPSLHPVIDAELCGGCGSCVDACPEGKILGLVDGKAALIQPTKCIGHGACRDACPLGAITLVFGTEKRGVDLPHVQPDFQTNVPGIFIAGELGGMGLIRNAVEQGRQAIDAIRRRTGGGGKGPKDLYDVVVVGAGPAGFSASLAAQEHGLKYLTLEQDSLGGTVYNYPRGKVVMTAPAVLPIHGKTRFRETTKEALLEFWKGVEKNTGVRIQYGTRVDAIDRDGDRFLVRTDRGSYRTRTVLLAIGRRGTPRKLGVPGEEQSKVVYRLIDPEQYRGRRVLVVGGGDSALEAAVSLSREPDTTVTLSYRSQAFTRAKEKNRKAVEAAAASGRLNLVLQSTVDRINGEDVTIRRGEEVRTIPNDAVVISAGGILPTGFLQKIGVEVVTHHGD